MKFLLGAAILLLAGLITFWQPASSVLFWKDDLVAAPTNEPHPIKDGVRAADSIDPPSSAEEPLNSPFGNQSKNKPKDDSDIFIPDPEAIASMRQARLNGEPRAPSLKEHHKREVPTEEELGNHERYLEYELRQKKRTYRAYVDASKIKTAHLRSMIEQGKAEGISEEQIAFAEKKILGIEEMATSLQQDFPDIMNEDYQPPADWLIESLGKDDNPIKSTEAQPKIAQ